MTKSTTGSLLPSRACVVITRNADPSTANMIHSDSTRGVIRRREISWDLLTDPVKLMSILAIAFRNAGEGTVIVDRVPVYMWDDGNDTGQLRQFVEYLKPAGWKAGAGIELGSGWVTFSAEGMPAVHMGIRRMMSHDRMVRPDDGPESVAERLSTYARLVGACYHATPGVAGTGAIRNLYNRPRVIKEPGKPMRVGKRLQPKWHWYTPPRIMSSGDIHWQRMPTALERELPYVLAFDVRADYLAAASRVKLGWEVPKETGPIIWDPELAGFFRIDTAGADWANPSKGVPIVNPIRIASDGSTWVTSPILAYISERGYPLPNVIDSWTTTAKSWILREWAEQLREALPDWRTAGDPTLREMIKQTYAETIGMCGRAGGLIARHDWHWTVADEARTGDLRKIHKVAELGHTPLKINVDSVTYASPDNDVDRWLRLLGTDPESAPLIGQFKIDKEHCMTMLEYLLKQRQTRSVPA